MRVLVAALLLTGCVTAEQEWCDANAFGTDHADCSYAVAQTNSATCYVRHVQREPDSELFYRCVDYFRVQRLEAEREFVGALRDGGNKMGTLSSPPPRSNPYGESVRRCRTRYNSISDSIEEECRDDPF